MLLTEARTARACAPGGSPVFFCGLLATGVRSCWEVVMEDRTCPAVVTRFSLVMWLGLGGAKWGTVFPSPVVWATNEFLVSTDPLLESPANTFDNRRVHVQYREGNNEGTFLVSKRELIMCRAWPLNFDIIYAYTYTLVCLHKLHNS